MNTDSEETGLIKVRRNNFNFLYSKYGLNSLSLVRGQELIVLICNDYLHTKLKYYNAFFKKNLIDREGNKWYQVSYKNPNSDYHLTAFHSDREKKLWVFLDIKYKEEVLKDIFMY